MNVAIEGILSITPRQVWLAWLSRCLIPKDPTAIAGAVFDRVASLDIGLLGVDLMKPLSMSLHQLVGIILGWNMLQQLTRSLTEISGCLRCPLRIHQGEQKLSRVVDR